MSDRLPIWGVLLAAGRGTRFGRTKHDLELGGVPMWRWSRDSLLQGGVEQVVVIGDFDGAVPGGERRRDSVAAGLAEIPSAEGFVLIHDAARPLVSVDVVRRVVTRLVAGDVAAVIPVVPVRDTIKRIDGGLVAETVDRRDLVSVQTPQGFDLRSLREAHAAFDGDPTDDALMIEAIGGTVAVVDGDAANIKVTYPEDLALAQALRSGRHG
ncbi:MAG: 2-C-methyl-D-erythritol 4-phosphate cytidylyltransferase [Actinomycetota bacterium]